MSGAGDLQEEGEKMYYSLSRIFGGNGVEGNG